MKKLKKVLAAASMLLLLSASLFADPPRKPADASLSVVEALQNSFRSISNTMLPAVVEVDVTETKTYTDPFGGMSNPFEFFFGPRGKSDDDNEKKNQTAPSESSGRRLKLGGYSLLMTAIVIGAAVLRRNGEAK